MHTMEIFMSKDHIVPPDNDLKMYKLDRGEYRIIIDIYDKRFQIRTKLEEADYPFDMIFFKKRTQLQMLEIVK